MRLSPVFVLCWLVLATCAGCSSEPPAPKTPAVPDRDWGAPVDGGRLVEPSIGEPSNLIPGIASDGSSSAVAGMIYVAPLRYNKDIELVPWAAKSFEVLDGGTHLKFTLRDDIRWFDGEPLTARDVEFTYRFMTDPQTPTPYADDWNRIAEFRRTGEYTFEVFYDEPYVRALLTWAANILPAHAYEGIDPLKSEYARKPLGAGAYKLTEWTPGQHLVLTANEDYFLGRPHITQRVIRFIPDQTTQLLELQAGNVDMMGLTPKQYLYQTPGEAWEARFAKYKYLSFGYTYLGFNHKHPFFKDVRVRRALSYAVDKQELVQVVLFGLGRATIGPYKPGTWVYNTDITPYGYDPDKARELLAEAGWTDTDGDGVLDKDGTPFAFTITTNQGNSARIKTAVVLQERFARIGVQVTIKTLEWATFIGQYVDKGRFDALIMGWNILQDPDLYKVWHSEQVPPQGLNFIHYGDEELDRMLEAARVTLDQQARKRYYDRAQEILHRDQPYIFLYVPYALPIVTKRVQGIEPAPAGIEYNYADWWIPKPLQTYTQ